jgi:hypothetical protein
MYALASDTKAAVNAAEGGLYDKLPRTVLWLPKTPIAKDAPVSGWQAVLNDGTWVGGTAGFDYFTYTNRAETVVVLEVTDDFVNGKIPSVSVQAFAGSSDQVTQGAVSVTDIVTVGGAKKAYIKVPVSFGATADGVRAWAALRVTVTDFEGASPENAGLSANGHVTDANDLLHQNIRQGSKDGAKSFTVFVSYLKSAPVVQITYGSAPVNSLDTSLGARQWSQYARAERIIGNRDISELDWDLTYVYELKEADLPDVAGFVSGGYQTTDPLGAQMHAPGGHISWTTYNQPVKSLTMDQGAVFVSYGDRWGNLKREVIQLNNLDGNAPKIVDTPMADNNTTIQGNTVTFDEEMGSGFKEIRVYEYNYFGGPTYLATLNAETTDVNALSGQQVITVQGAKTALDIVVVDLVGNMTVAHMYHLTPDANSVTITVNLRHAAVAAGVSAQTQSILQSQGLALDPAFQLLKPGVEGYEVLLQDVAVHPFEPEGAVLAVAAPQQNSERLQLRVLTLGSVEALLIQSMADGRAVTYKPGNAAGVQSLEGGRLKLWTLEGAFTPGDVQVAAKVDGDWGETATIVPVETLPAEDENTGSQGLDGSVADPVDDDPAADPAQKPAVPTSAAPAPVKKNFLQLLLEWFVELFRWVR